MTRPTSLLLIATAVAWAVACAGTPAAHRSAGGADRPNLILLLTDDQRFDMVGHVTPGLETPSMDRLAAQGVRFENMFVTTPICTASRASILTGTYERTHRFNFNTPPLSRALTDASYPAILRASGYRSGFVGKFGVDVEPGAVEVMFDRFVPLERNPYFKELAGGGRRHLTELIGDEAIGFLEEQRRGEPFVLSVSFHAPHAEDGDERQFIPPDSTAHLYSERSFAAPALSTADFVDSLPPFLRDPEACLNRFRWQWRFDEEEKRQRMTRNYWRMISGVDMAIGRILDRLDELHLADDTVIVFTSDNGYFLGERGYAGKWLPHELSLRVPLIVVDPRTDARGGRTAAAAALNVDLAATLLDLAGAPMPASMQGRTLRPLLESPARVPRGWRRDFFFEQLVEFDGIARHEGVRETRFKYSRYIDQEPPYEELYDLASDPLESRNLAADPAAKRALERLRSRCDELRRLYGPTTGPVTGS